MPVFELVPFPSGEILNITITGSAERKGNLLSIHYKVNGDVDLIIFPGTSKSPARKDDLWKATCFEFFLAISDQPGYWEFNMSPSGNWNAYKMDAYRQVNMREEPAFTGLPFEFKQNDNNCSINISVNLNPIIQPAHNLQIGLTAIIQTKDGSESYWALSHPGSQADFHLRESFTLSL
jgi:hypothetical protein